VRYKGDTVDRWSAEDFLDAAAAPTAPVYASPGNGGVYANTPPAALDWNDVDVATSYDVYLDGALKANVTATDYALTGVTLGTHTWQIRAKNSAGTAAGATWSFTTLASPAKPSSPYPASGASIATLPTKLDWANAANASSYDVYLNGALLGNVTTSEWSLVTPPPAKVMQTWRVVAKNAGSSTAGDDWTFQVDPIMGDANADGVVGSADFSIVYGNMNTAGGWSKGDFDGDGAVTFVDYQIYQRNYGRTAPASPPPAPASAPPVVVGVLADAGTDPKRPPFSSKPIGKPAPVVKPKPTPAKRAV
jgi:hypothetical protein